MSTDKNYKIGRILQNLRHLLEVDNMAEVAEYLGISPKTLSAWKRRNSQSALEKILLRSEEFDREDLLKGALPAGVVYQVKQTMKGETKGSIQAHNSTVNVNVANQKIELTVEERELILLLRKYGNPNLLEEWTNRLRAAKEALGL